LVKKKGENWGLEKKKKGFFFFFEIFEKIFREKKLGAKKFGGKKFLKKFAFFLGKREKKKKKMAPLSVKSFLKP